MSWVNSRLVLIPLRVGRLFGLRSNGSAPQPHKVLIPLRVGRLFGRPHSRPRGRSGMVLIPLRVGRLFGRLAQPDCADGCILS